MKIRKIITLMMALIISLASVSAFAEPITFLPALETAANMPENIPEAYNPRFIQRYNDTLYFVDEQGDGSDDYDAYIHTPYAMDAAGNIQKIGEARRYALEYEFSDEEYSYMSELMQHNGYSDMTVYGDYIYFIGTDDTPGSYTTYSPYWNEGEMAEYTSTYAGTACVYRMNLDGSNLVKLIPGLGNGGAHLDIAGDRIAVTSCYLNNFFVYDFHNFMFYDLEGNFISEFRNPADPEDNFAYTKDTQFNLIVQGIFTDGQEIYASLSDSEGDFASSRLVKIPDTQNELLLEAYFVNSVMLDNGGFVYFTSDAEDVFWDECMEDSLTIRVYENGANRILARVPADYAEGWTQQLFVIDDMVYFTSDSAMLRVSLNGGDVMRLENGAFVTALECSPEYYNSATIGIIGGADGPTAIFVTEAAEEEPFYYLPDSNTRLYSRDELEQYDTELLGFMRNEILARHGYPFKKEMYRNYFESMPWYTRDENFAYNMLNAIEMENVETIKAIEASR